MRDKSGVVFDIQAKDVEAFLESYENLKSNNSSRVDFNVSRCKSLPDLEGEGRHDGGSYGGRGGGDSDPNGDNRGGGYGGGSRRDKDEGDGRRAGGYDGGYKKRDYGNGGGGRQVGSSGGGWNGASSYDNDIMQPIEDDPPLYNNHQKKPKYNIYTP